MWTQEFDIDLGEWQNIEKEICCLEKVVGGYERGLYGSEYWKAITSHYGQTSSFGQIKEGAAGGRGGRGGDQAFEWTADDSVMVDLNEGLQIELNNQEQEFKSNVVSNWKIPELALSENPSALPPINPKKFNFRESEFS